MIAYQAYPTTNNTIALSLVKQVMLAVKYPKYLELYEELGVSTIIPQRVFLEEPVSIISFTDRRDLYNLLTYEPLVGGYLLNDKGKMFAEGGYECFSFVDHLSHPIEYAIVNPQKYVFHTSSLGIPIGISELNQAIEDLESLDDIATMYEVSKESILQRLRQHNLSEPKRIIYPPEDFMEYLVGKVLGRVVTPDAAADMLGVSIKQLRAWWNSGK